VKIEKKKVFSNIINTGMTWWSLQVRSLIFLVSLADQSKTCGRRLK